MSNTGSTSSMPATPRLQASEDTPRDDSDNASANELRNENHVLRAQLQAATAAAAAAAASEESMRQANRELQSRLNEALEADYELRILSAAQSEQNMQNVRHLEAKDATISTLHQTMASLQARMDEVLIAGWGRDTENAQLRINYARQRDIAATTKVRLAEAYGDLVEAEDVIDDLRGTMAELNERVELMGFALDRAMERVAAVEQGLGVMEELN